MTIGNPDKTPDGPKGEPMALLPCAHASCPAMLEKVYKALTIVKMECPQAGMDSTRVPPINGGEPTREVSDPKVVGPQNKGKGYGKQGWKKQKGVGKGKRYNGH